MGIAFPLIMGTISIAEMMDMFVVRGGHMPVAVQEAFTAGITGAFLLSAVITVPAIIVSAMCGREDMHSKRMS